MADGTFASPGLALDQARWIEAEGQETSSDNILIGFEARPRLPSGQSGLGSGQVPVMVVSHLGPDAGPPTPSSRAGIPR